MKRTKKQDKAYAIFDILDDLYPHARAELDFSNPFELLIATVLSAQTRDTRVNHITPDLFREYPTPEKLAQAEQEDIEKIIKSLGYYRAKSERIIALAQQLIENYDGVVPPELDELTTLPGVGRKTAFVVLGSAFDQPGITVDTHFGRLSRRFGWTKATNPDIVEREIAKLFEPQVWTRLSSVIIFHGRRVCHAQKPACGICPLMKICPSAGKVSPGVRPETNRVKAEKLLAYDYAIGQPMHDHLMQRVPLET
jgi:endonuclease-3